MPHQGLNMCPSAPKMLPIPLCHSRNSYVFPFKTCIVTFFTYCHFLFKIKKKFFYGCTQSVWKFLDQELKLSHSCGNTRFLTHWASTWIEPISSQTLCWVINPLSYSGTPLFLNRARIAALWSVLNNLKSLWLCFYCLLCLLVFAHGITFPCSSLFFGCMLDGEFETV